MRKFLWLALCTAAPLFAQNPARDFRIVLPKGTGAITTHIGDGWVFHELHLFNDGPGPLGPIYRPALFLTNDQQKLGASYMLFANDTKGTTSEACRTATMGPIIEGDRKRHWDLKNIQESTYTTPDGHKLLVTSYLIDQADGRPVHQQNVFAFIGDTHNCAEVHLSKTLYEPADDRLFNAMLNHFTYSADYTPTPQDYGTMATAYFEDAHDPRSAVPYYRSALETLADAPVSGYDSKTMRRVFTDQLSMSYGMSGDLKRSREVNEAAIAKDPDYPLYYYNLACADAESGDATAARDHLEQAFNRRANTIKGETLPNPALDDSILKLQSDKAFWTFVQSLPKS